MAVILLWWAAFGFPGVAFFVILDTEMDTENKKSSIYALFSVSLVGSSPTAGIFERNRIDKGKLLKILYLCGFFAFKSV